MSTPNPTGDFGMNAKIWGKKRLQISLLNPRGGKFDQSTMKTPISHLTDLNACRDAVEWVKASKCRSLETAWLKCARADWMIWYAERKAGPVGSGSRINLILIACECAELVLPIFERAYPNDNRPRKAIESARAYALNPCEKTANAAYAAADATYAAAKAAAKAAAYATDAAYAAYAAAAYAAKKDIQAKFCKIVRKYFPTLPRTGQPRQG